MYIKQVEVENYRNLKNVNIDFYDGLNIIVGPNNTGKSNVLKALSFITNDPNKEININDFNMYYLKDLYSRRKTTSPSISITYEIEHLLDFNVIDSALSKMMKFLVYNDDGDLTNLSGDMFKLNGKLKLKLELDSRRQKDFLSEVKSKAVTFKEYLRVINDFKEFFSWTYYNLVSNEKIDRQIVNDIFDVDYIIANRNIDEITNNTQRYVEKVIKDAVVDERAIKAEINDEISKGLFEVTETINNEINKDQEEIGIISGNNKFSSIFNFDDRLSRYFQYELENIAGDFKLPVINNGLGYNNLIYIRNILNQKKLVDYNVILLEEPEAHLHPNMQYKLLKYINNLHSVEMDENLVARNQIFLSTHSPNITASAKLDDIIMIDYVETSSQNNVFVSQLKNRYEFDYISKHLDMSKLQTSESVDTYEKELSKSKKHLMKFLDVTRSDLLFASNIIFVEGLTEKILLPEMIKSLGYEKQFYSNHVSIVEVNGINFNQFIPLFVNTGKKVLILSDIDYEYFNKMKNLKDLTDYKQFRAKKIKKIIRTEYADFKNIKVETQYNYGSTFEVEFFLDNFDNLESSISLLKIVMPKSCNSILKLELDYKVWTENIDMINHPHTKKYIKNMIDKFEVKTIHNYVFFNKLFFGLIYYNYAKKSKGDLALEISLDFISNNYKVPKYIEEGIKWLLG